MLQNSRQETLNARGIYYSCNKDKNTFSRWLTSRNRVHKIQTSSKTESMKKALRDANTARCLCRPRGPSSISVPNLKRIALFVQKLLRGKNFEIESRDPGHAHLGVVLWSLRREAPSSMSVPKLKRIALFVQKLLGGPKISKLGHVTQATPT